MHAEVIKYDDKENCIKYIQFLKLGLIFNKSAAKVLFIHMHRSCQCADKIELNSFD